MYVTDALTTEKPRRSEKNVSDALISEKKRGYKEKSVSMNPFMLVFRKLKTWFLSYFLEGYISICY